MSACPFCDRIVAREYDWSWLGAVSFEPLNPVTPGHRLFVTTSHSDPLVNPYGFTDESQRTRGLDAVLPLFYMWRREERITEDYNLILNAGASASQTIEHLHLHYVPRRAGDGLLLPWTGHERGSSVPKEES